MSGSASIAGSTSALPLEYPQAVPFRQVGADSAHTQQQTLTGTQSSFIHCTLTVHPTLPTCLTLKMYGSNPQH